jgi:SAM-dependent methyltransferase
MFLSKILDNPLVWNVSRSGLELAWGLYRRRREVLEEWGLLANRPSLIDIGCGVGQFALLTGGRYLGVDLNARYIDHARRRYRGHPNVEFRRVDVTTLLDEGTRFDLALIVDLLHHIPDDDVVRLLATAARVARRNVINFEPMREQPHPLGDWLVRHDRGRFMRTREQLLGLYKEAGLTAAEVRPLRIGPVETMAVLSRLSVPVPALERSRAARAAAAAARNQNSVRE